MWVEISLGAGIVSPAPRHTEDQRFFPGAASKALFVWTLFGTPGRSPEAQGMDSQVNTPSPVSCVAFTSTT